MFENYRTFKTTFAGRELMVETGKVCGLANGSCWIHYGESVVMVNVAASPKPREGVDFFPLSVDYEEKLYAVGKIPGGYLKREGRPSEKAILTSRVVDRPMRPLFPKDMRNDVAITMTVLAVDPDTQPEILSMNNTVLPAVKEAQDMGKWGDELYDIYKKQADQCKNAPQTPAWTQIQLIVTEELQNALSGSVTCEEAAAIMDERINEVLG